MIGCPVVALQGAVVAKLGEDRFGEPCFERGSDDQAVAGEITPRGREVIAASGQPRVQVSGPAAEFVKPQEPEFRFQEKIVPSERVSEPAADKSLEGIGLAGVDHKIGTAGPEFLKALFVEVEPAASKGRTDNPVVKPPVISPLEGGAQHLAVMVAVTRAAGKGNGAIGFESGHPGAERGPETLAAGGLRIVPGAIEKSLQTLVFTFIAAAVRLVATLRDRARQAEGQAVERGSFHAKHQAIEVF